MQYRVGKLLVVYVPLSAVEQVKDAVFSVGGGVVGAYTHCAWQTTGQGQFVPTQAATPAIGSAGQCEQVEEIKLEILCDNGVLDAVSRAVTKSHPYEEPVFFFLDLISGRLPS